MTRRFPSHIHSDISKEILKEKRKQEKAKRNKAYEDFIKILEKWPDFLDSRVKCPVCKGNGVKSADNFKVIPCTNRCESEGGIKGSYTIDENDRKPGETIEEKRKRCLKNAKKEIIDSNNPNLIEAIINFQKPRKKFSPEIKKRILANNYQDAAFFKKKFEGSKPTKSLASGHMHILYPPKRWNYNSLFEVWINYLLRGPSTAQTRQIKKVTGLDKKWYRLDFDYYSCWDMLSDIKSIKFDPESRHEIAEELAEDFRKLNLEPYGTDRESFSSRIEQIWIEQEKQLEDKKAQLAQLIIQRLAECISNGYENFRFDENMVDQLTKPSQKLLYKFLKKSQSVSAQKFLEKWNENIGHELDMYYDLDFDHIQRIIARISRKKDPYREIEGLVAFNNKKYKFKKTEHEEIEYKSSIFTKKPKVEADVKSQIQKTIVAFLNSNGGKICIGVDDEGVIIGIDGKSQVYWEKNKTPKHNQNLDKFHDDFERSMYQFLTDKKQDSINHHVKVTKKIHFQNITLPQTKEVIHVISVEPALFLDAYFYDTHHEPHYYIRKNANTTILNTKQCNEYRQEKLKKENS